jgi:hypothetical protein
VPQIPWPARLPAAASVRDDDGRAAQHPGGVREAGARRPRRAADLIRSAKTDANVDEEG